MPIGLPVQPRNLPALGRAVIPGDTLLVSPDGLVLNQATPLQMSRYLQNAALWTPGAIANGAQVSTTVTVTGAVIGDFVEVSYNAAFNGVLGTSGYVSAASTVTVVLQNNSGGAITPTAGTVLVRTHPQ